MKSLRAYLLTLAAALILVSSVAFALIVWDSHRASRQQTETQLQETANILSLAVDGELKGAIGILSALSASRAASSADWAAVDLQARKSIDGRNAWVVVQDRSGRQLVNTSLPLGTELPAGPAPEAMWRELSPDRPRICDLATGFVSRRILCIDMLIPGGRDQAISIVMRPSFFGSVVDRNGVEQGHLASLVDRSGHIIWRNINPDKHIGSSTTGTAREAIQSANEGTLESVNLDGVRSLTAFKKSPLSGWTVVVAIPLEQTVAGVRQAQWRGSLLALIVLALGCIAALFVARRISRSLRDVSAAAKQGQFGGGKPFRSTGFAELDELQSALREAAAAQAESEQRFREVADAAPVLIWVADTRNKGIWYNRAWLDFVGRSMEQEVGDGWLDGVHPDDKAGCAEVCGGAFDRREPFRIEFRLRRHDGEWRTIDDRGVPRFADDGEFLGYVGSCLDVTDARRSEAAIRASEERYRRIFEQTSDLLLTADLQQRITDCNPASAEAVGLSRREVIGRHISDFISPDDFERTTDMLRAKLDRGGTTRYDVQVRSSTGDWLYWEINSGLTFDDIGNPVGLHVVGRDVTERKRLERQQRLLVGELNHRVKNTLAIVQSLAHQTFRGDVPAQQAVASFEGRIQALAAAHNLLTRENWDSAPIGEVIVEALAPFCSDERCSAAGPDLRLPPKMAVGLSLAVHELATNASKYGALSKRGGRIHVSWDVSGGTLELNWREEGGPAVRTPSVTGFGTRMICRGLASELGGTVDLAFEPQGVTCRVVAPVPKVEDNH